MLVDRRVVRLALFAIGLGVLAAGVSFVFIRLIALVTNIAFFQRISIAAMPPSANQLGLWVLVVPVVGGLIVGFMARYGSKAIRGHGIPEAMEQVLTNEEPHSSAGHISETALGRDRDRHRRTVRRRRSDHRHRRSTRLADRPDWSARRPPSERRCWRPARRPAWRRRSAAPCRPCCWRSSCCCSNFARARSFPWRLASATAAGVRHGDGRLGADVRHAERAAPTLAALAFYALLGCAMGWLAVQVTRLVYAVEDGFERLPIHWMWWPAIGAIAVGVCRLLRARARSASATTTLPPRFPVNMAVRAALRALRDEVHLLVDLARQRHVGRHARAAVHDWRRDRRRRWASWSRVRLPGLGVECRRGGPGRHGGDVRRCVAGVLGVGRVRV